MHGMTRRSALTLGILGASGALAAPALAAPPTFADVPASLHFSKEIEWLAAQGVSTGWTQGGARYYRPLLPVARDAMAAFLYRLAGQQPYTPPRTSPFRDVTPSTQFYKEICWLSDAGVAGGYADGTFRPLSSVNRDAMAAFLYRLNLLSGPVDVEDAPWLGGAWYGSMPPDSSPFRDIDESTQFYAEMCWLAETGVSTGYPDRTFRPLAPVNRDAMAAFMRRVNPFLAYPADGSTVARVSTVALDAWTLTNGDPESEATTVLPGETYSITLTLGPDDSDGHAVARAIQGTTTVRLGLYATSSRGAELRAEDYFQRMRLARAFDFRGRPVPGVTATLLGSKVDITATRGFAGTLTVELEFTVPSLTLPSGSRYVEGEYELEACSNSERWVTGPADYSFTRAWDVLRFATTRSDRGVQALRAAPSDGSRRGTGRPDSAPGGATKVVR